jgi:hypothetical protein
MTMTYRNMATTGIAALALCGVLITIACGSSSPASPSGGTSGGGGGAPTLTDIQTQIFNPGCVTCHTSSGRTPAAGLDLETAVAWDNLVNVASTGKPGAVRVIPSDANNSYLIKKLIGASDIVGLRMPRNGPPYLSDAQVAMIQQWIAAGAAKN